MDLQRPVVSVIVERRTSDGLEILLQRRHKPEDPFHGTLELPQGKIESGESIFRSAQRELIEETGLHLSELRDASGASIIDAPNMHSFVPLTCVVDPVNNYVGIALVGTASGTPRPTKEGSHHSWISLGQLLGVIRSGQVFPLNVAMLEAYMHRYARDAAGA